MPSRTYLDITNNVLKLAGWNTLSSSNFATLEERPFPQARLMVNRAKSKILTELGIDLIDDEFEFRAFASTNGQVSGQPSLTLNAFSLTHPAGTGSASGTFASAPSNRTGLLVANYGKLKLPTESDTYFRITATDGSTTITVSPYADNATYTDWVLLRDEFPLNDTVRAVNEMWTSNGPISLRQIEHVASLDYFHPGNTELGDPVEAAIYRSQDPANDVLQVRLYPIPDTDIFIHYKARTMPANLSAHDDTWTFEDEIIDLIEERALQMLLASPILNDSDLALVAGAQTARDVDAYRERYGDRSKNRRRRRRGPDERFGNRGDDFWRRTNYDQ